MQFSLSAPAPDTCFLFLVRHGATDNNQAQPPRLQGGTSDPSLSTEGRGQAERCGQLFTGQPISAIYSSPLKRAQETAQAIARPHGLTVQMQGAFRECDVGDWDGRDWESIMATWPEEYRRHMEDPGLHGYVGGENFTQVADRVAPAIQELLGKHAGQNVILVAHNIVNRCILAHSMELPLKYARRLKQNNCGVNVLRYRRGELKVVTVNAAWHL